MDTPAVRETVGSLVVPRVKNWVKKDGIHGNEGLFQILEPHRCYCSWVSGIDSSHILLRIKRTVFLHKRVLTLSPYVTNACSRFVQIVYPKQTFIS
jgi:hypothetical protein